MANDTLDQTLLLLSLPARDPLRRIEDATFWLEAYRQGVEGNPMRIFEAVDGLDELVHPQRLELTRNYLVSAGQTRSFREERMWNAVVRFARELAAGYEACLTLFRAGAQGAGDLRPVLPIVAARAMRALTLELRWSLLRYATVDPTLWARMGDLFAFAERADLVRARLKVYPAMNEDSTIRREYLRALVLAVSGMENLLPPSQIVAERAIATVAEFFLLHRRPASACHFAVDLKAERGPYRMLGHAQGARSLRHFGPGDAGVLLRGLIESAEGGTVPTQLRLNGNFDAALAAETLAHLARNWGPTPPERGESRQRVLARMHVVHGMEDVFSAVTDDSDAFLDEIAEAWTVEDESSSGFGATLPALETDWLSVGALVAARYPWPGPWSIGIVRRLSTHANGKRAVGVQILAKGAIPVRFAPGSNQRANILPAILLASDSESSLSSGQVSLIAPKGRMVQAASHTMQVGQREYLLTSNAVTEAGADFELIRSSIRASVR